jgi:hypothetical protein
MVQNWWQRGSSSQYFTKKGALKVSVCQALSEIQDPHLTTTMVNASVKLNLPQTEAAAAPREEDNEIALIFHNCVPYQERYPQS